jgi:sensor domain CHASE-containing protein|tara:strand:+ start:2915 stop:3148 length:234 start_codon:yes stop_codon:yes gene_type:complete
MCVTKKSTIRLSARRAQKGWLLLAVVMMVLLIALGVAMLMSQAQLSLRSVRQEHQALQEKLKLWPPVLKHREYVDAQ